MTKQDIETLIQQYFPQDLQNVLLQYQHRFSQLQEIRCRVQKPLLLRYAQGKEEIAAHTVTQAQLQHIISRMTQGSLYAWEEELRRGYLTLPGGFRVGLAGKGVLESGSIRTLKQISSVNIRIARAMPGAADSLMPLLYKHQAVQNCLVVSPPGGGKTTLLRDIIRQISDGVPELSQPGRMVAVVDERSELAGSVNGIAQMDVGCRTDILDGCPKSEGIRMLIRAMGPQVIAADEIGTESDVQALKEAVQSGVSVIATAHGETMDSVYRHPVLKQFILNGCFSLIVFLQWQNEAVVPHVYQLTGGNGYEALGHDTADWGGKCHGVL